MKKIIHDLAKDVVKVDWKKKGMGLSDAEKRLKMRAIRSVLKDPDDPLVFIHFIEFVQEYDKDYLDRVRDTYYNVMYQKDYDPNNPETEEQYKKAQKKLGKFLLGKKDVEMPEPKDTKVDLNDLEIMIDMRDARTWLSQRVKDVCKKFNLTEDDFKVIYGEDVPQTLRKLDPEAFGFQAIKIEGTKTKGETRGTQTYLKKDNVVKKPKEWAEELGLTYQQFRKKLANGALSGFEVVENPNKNNEKDGNLPPEFDYESITKKQSFVYWVYRSEIPAVDAAGLTDADALLDALFPYEKGELAKRKKAAADKRMQEERDRVALKQIAKDIETKDRKDSVEKAKSIDKDDTFDLDDLNPTDDDLSNTEDVQLATDDEILAASKADKNSDYADDEEDEYGDDWSRKQRQASDYYDNSDDSEDGNYDTGDYDYNRHGSRW